MTGVALIAGRGALPRLIADELRASSTPYCVAVFEGTEADWASDHPHIRAPFEKLGRVVEAFRNAGCTQLCMAGGMERPRLNPLKFDATFARFAPRVLPKLGKGDDAALRAVVAFFEAEGFEVVPPEQFLDGLVLRAGAVTRTRPNEAALQDIATAERILSTTAALDIGQGCVVCAGLCLGVETVQGTDFMLNALRGEHGRKGAAASGGVLVKLPKDGQERRVDLPAIGPDTVRNAAAAGLEGIAGRAGGLLLIDRASMLQAADEAGLFIWGIEG
ncbi:MAG: UDP-2,3-diacylglucosamine diphosphatase LpxI [Pseudomonadota bacterium]